MIIYAADENQQGPFVRLFNSLQSWSKQTKLRPVRPQQENATTTPCDSAADIITTMAPVEKKKLRSKNAHF